MDNLIIYNQGGFPLNMEDLGFLQYEAHEGVCAFLRSLGDNYIVSGCEIELNNNITLTCTAGWVMIGGELLKHEEEIIVGYPMNLNFYKDVSSTDNRLFKNGSWHDVKQINRAKVNLNITQPSTKFKTLKEKLLEKMDLKSDQWHYIGNPHNGLGTTLQSPWTFDAGTSLFVPPRFRKTDYGRVEIQGDFTANNNIGGTIFTLPTGYYDGKLHYVPIIDGNVKARAILITGNGSVVFGAPPAGSNMIEFSFTLE